LNITVTVTNNLGGPVANATVAIGVSLNGTAYATGSGVTGANGQVEFTLDDAPPGTYRTTVNRLKATGLTSTGEVPANSYNDPN
jgi:hypothetical protein